MRQILLAMLVVLSVGCATMVSPNGTITSSAPVLGTAHVYMFSRPAVRVSVSLNSAYICKLYVNSEEVGSISWERPEEVWVNQPYGYGGVDGFTVYAKCRGEDGHQASDHQNFYFPRSRVEHEEWEIRPRPLRRE